MKELIEQFREAFSSKNKEESCRIATAIKDFIYNKQDWIAGYGLADNFSYNVHSYFYFSRFNTEAETLEILEKRIYRLCETFANKYN